MPWSPRCARSPASLRRPGPGWTTEVEALARRAEDAYRAASTGSQDDRAEAWTSFAAAKVHKSEAARCRALLYWIDNGGPFESVAWEGSCFATPEAAGYFLAAEGLLEGRRRITVPGTSGHLDDRWADCVVGGLAAPV